MLFRSVSLIPALQVFYGMAKKGLPVPEIVSEMNARLKDLMPAGRCIAAVLLRLSPDSLSGEAWNGGMPPLFLLAGDGRVRSTLVSRHLPLGIASQDQFDAATQRLALKDWAGASQLLEDFRQRFPREALQAQVPPKLALAYSEQGRWADAAAEAEQIGRAHV